MNKVHGIKSDSFVEFIKLINEFSKINNVFATQTHIDTSERSGDIFYAFVWYNEETTQKAQNTPQKQENQASEIKTEKIPSKPFRKPTDKMMYFLDKAWKIPEGREYLKEIGFDGNFELLDFYKAKDYISKIKTKQEES